MSPKLHEFLVTLHRRAENAPWGIRLIGGSDLNAPLIITKVSPNSPAAEELLRGDVITKIEEYDARDLTHQDAQRLFTQAQSQIKLVIRRDDIIAVKQTLSNESSRCPSTVPADHLFESSIPNDGRPSGVHSPLPHGPQNYARAMMSPVENLPHTVFPPTPDVISEELNFAQQQQHDTAVTAEQPYRTTPLILPGAKVNKNNLPTESYLRHHPNPAVRAHPTHDFHDVLMKQKLAHKQFNSPIGLYSDSNIENTIKQSVPGDYHGSYQVPPQTQHHYQPGPPARTLPQSNMPNKIQGYKKTVVFDPTTSATFKALHEDEVVEDAEPVQPKVFRPNRMVPAKKPNAYHPAPQPEFYNKVNTLGESTEVIHQSGSFKRLMHHVLGETDY
ncbi:PDZ and LIM domain protein 3 isoform X2 [Culicoides brevitarsis]|uniref:PDZ and LIM domain protein 3 isoform X2 n=1 Tax=Culicoides brevitarsis TaxID=469753 RepID=UPI00307B3365